jgi:hypothetical protein
MKLAVLACTSCGWVRRSEESAGVRCPLCDAPARRLTPNGSLAPGRAALAAATARALHAPGVVPVSGGAESRRWDARLPAAPPE